MNHSLRRRGRPPRVQPAPDTGETGGPDPRQLEIGFDAGADSGETASEADGAGEASLHRALALFIMAVNHPDTRVAWEDLGRKAQEEGWIWRLQQESCIATQYGSFVVTFRLLIGRADEPEGMFWYDSVSVQVPANLASPTMLARHAALPSVINAVFGGLPPGVLAQLASATAPAAAEPPEGAPVNGAIAPEVEVDVGEPPAPGLLPAVVRGRSRTGAPIFDNLFEIKAPVDQIIASVMNELEIYLADVNTAEDVVAVYNDNPVIGEFFQDHGSEADRKELQSLLRVRKDALVGDPARRAPSRPH